MKKITFLFDGIHDVEGHPRAFTKGQSETVPDEDAKRLVAGLCAEYYQEAKPAPKQVKKAVTHDQDE